MGISREQRSEVYVLKPELDRFRYLAYVDESDARFLIDRFDGRLIGHEWRPIPVEVPEEDLDRPDCDFPSFSTRPTLSAKAATAVEDLLVGSGELLPLLCSLGSYYVFNVTRLIDALDLDRSAIERFKSSGRIMHVRKYVLRKSCIGSAPVFKLEGIERGEVFVSDEFRRRWLAAGLTGAVFEPVEIV